VLSGYQKRCTLSSQDEDFQALIRRVVEESGISQAQLARDAGLSYAALHAWIIGARSPRTESLIQLAGGLESRSDALRELAKQLRQSAQKSPAQG
jgi:transcriptional regulator with XRE-family HTH domain